MSAVPFPVELPSALAATLWRGSELGHAHTAVRGSGWEELDRELPGAGWPCGSLNEVLCPEFGMLEWRLLGRGLQQALHAGGRLVLVAPPAIPYLPGLASWGIAPDAVVWIRAQDAQQALWAGEQVLRASSDGALVLWLHQARAESLRRLHAHAQAQGGTALVFALRPQAALQQASPAPLRVQARAGADGDLLVRVCKRRGPPQAGELRLSAWPSAVDAVRPRQQLGRTGVSHVVGRLVAGTAWRAARAG